MNIVPFYEPESGTWSYLVADTGNGKAAIIDPVWVYDSVSGIASEHMVNEVLELASTMNCEVDWVLETHAHADHLSAAALIREKTGAKIGASRGICDVQATFKKIYNLADLHTDGRQFDRLLSEGDQLEIGELIITVMETPGHTDDSVTYLVGDAAFIGDTLFAPNFGSARCDFPGGNAGKLYDSIQKIYALPASTRLFLCHDYPPAGGEAKSMVILEDSIRDNIHVKADTTREAYIEMRETRDAQLKLPKLILPAIQVNLLAGAAPSPEKNGHSYLKIPFNISIAELLEDKND
jgi:glyoxylase-like metal-dependent hydrolase (beta-lactamase superfamily II)